MDDKGKIIYWNVSLLEQMNSYLLDNEIAKEAFSFEQLLTILSNRDSEYALKDILYNPNSIGILKSIGKDSQDWQAKLQHLMDLGRGERNYFIYEFGDDGETLIQQERKRREERFSSMERGYIEDEEYGIIDDVIAPISILDATFGITYDEAKDLIKKYGIDLDKLDIQTEVEKKIQRKLQIIKELITPQKFESYDEEIEYYEKYYYSHKQELLEISRNVSAFYKVDLEKSFLDLYARQYDRTLKVETSKLENLTYEGKEIQVYEASGDFTILIRGEQNISPENEQNFWNTTEMQIKGLCQCTIGQDYIRTVNYDSDKTCYVASTSCKDGELLAFKGVTSSIYFILKFCASSFEFRL